jgi:heme-degrading monooxygenase HmoA
MILREWRGRAAPGKIADYPAHFRAAVLPELRRIRGFLGATLSRRSIDGGAVEYLVLTRWQSLDAIRAFAGSEIGEAVVEPAAVAALVDFDRNVRHYEIVEDAAPLSG